MKPSLRLIPAILLAALGSLLSASSTHAQDGIMPVTVQFSAGGLEWIYPQTGRIAATIYEGPISSDPGHAVRGYRTSEKYGNGSGGPIQGNWTDLRMEVGKPYHMQVTITSMYVNWFKFLPPVGYKVEIAGIVRNTIDSLSNGASVELRVLPDVDEAPTRAGQASSLTNGRLYWRVSMGSLQNGASARSITLVDSVIGTSWATLFTPSALTYDKPGSEVQVYTDTTTGALRQVYANEACADIVPISSTKYKILMYARSEVPTGSMPFDFDGNGKHPFVVYTVEDPAGTGTSTSIKITSDTYNGSSLKRTAVTTLERSGSTWPNYTWTLKDWDTNNSSPHVQDERTGTSNYYTNANDYAVDLSYVLKDPNLSSGIQKAVEGSRRFQMFAWGEELVAEHRGPSGSGLDKAYDYYTTSTDPDSYTQLKTVTLPGGAWEAYEYFGPGAGGFTDGGLKIHRSYLGYPTSVPSTLSSNTDGLITTYTYFPTSAIQPLRLKEVATTVKESSGASSRLVSKTEFDALATLPNTNGSNVFRAVRYDWPENDSGKRLKTTTRFYSDTLDDIFYRGQVLSIERPDKSKTVNVLQKGTWDGTTFVANGTPDSSHPPGSRLCVLHGTVDGTMAGVSSRTTYDGYSLVTGDTGATDAFYAVSGRSVAEVAIRDATARVVRTEMRVWDGTDWQLVSAETLSYDGAGFLTGRTGGNGAQYSATYEGEIKQTETDSAGTTINYTSFDSAGRVTQSKRAGSGGSPEPVPELTTGFEYDAAGRITKRTIGTSETLIATTSFDTAGRQTAQSIPGPSGAISTSISYDATNRTRTTTFPNAKTRVEAFNQDGSLASVTSPDGGVISRHFTYSFESDGRRCVQVNTAGSSSARWQKSWTDWLGRTVKTSRPTFSSASEFVEESFYDNGATGLLKRQTRSDYADTLFEFDSMGRLTRSGLDVTTGSPQALTEGSSDRITESTIAYGKTGSDWWLTETTKGWLTAGSGTSSTLSTVQTRLSGFGTSPVQLAETKVTDMNSNVTTTSVTVDRSNHTVTTTTTTAGISNSSTQVSKNGLPTGTTGFEGLNYTSQYDALGRLWKSSDPRTGTTTTTYKSNSAHIDQVTSPASKVVTYAYDGIGRVTSFKNENDKFTYTAYDDLGRVKQQWGDAISPVEYAYNSYGDPYTTKTYRGGSGWTSSGWPGSPGTADTTTTNYDAASGLLANKTFQDSSAVSFQYNSRMLLSRRTWQRGTYADYTYFSTGELDTINYSDSTPDVSYTYKRSGVTDQITDATGARSFSYRSDLQPDVETLNSTFFGGRTMASTYDSVSRANGFELRNGSTVETANVLTFNSATGRIETAARNPGGTAFTYAYTTGSNLVYTATSGAFQQKTTYETDRDLVHDVDAQWNSLSLAKSAYTYDNQGRRDTSVQTGAMYARYPLGAVTVKYGYNDRSELTSAATSYGSADDSSKRLTGRQYGYGLDNAGNRSSASVDSRSMSYTPNNLNQITSRDTPSYVDATGFAPAAASVTVNSSAASRPGSGDYFYKSVTGVSQPSWQTISVASTSPTGSDTRHAFVPAGTEPFGYDADGNLTSDGRWNYDWDAENRLVTMETYGHRSGQSTTVWTSGVPQLKIDFKYDYAGRRVSKTVSTWNGSTFAFTSETRFAYHGWNLAMELGVSGSTFTIQRSYLWGVDTAGSYSGANTPGSLLAVIHASGTVHVVASDGQGNVTALVNQATSGIEAAYEYSPFGETIRETGPAATANPFRSATKYTDNETGLVYYGHRYYSPSLGRFINRDPIGEAGGTNLYGFVGNSPVNGSDYLGLDGTSADNQGRSPWIGTSVNFGGELLGDWTDNINSFDRTIIQWFIQRDRTEAGAREYQAGQNITAELSRRHGVKQLVYAGYDETGKVAPNSTGSFWDRWAQDLYQASLESNSPKVQMARQMGEDAENYGLAGLYKYVPIVGSGFGTLEMIDGSTADGHPLGILDYIDRTLNTVGSAAAAYSLVSVGGKNAININTAGKTAEEIASLREYAKRTNEWLKKNGPSTIQSTKGALRREASALAAAERRAAARAGKPYRGQTGHVPDTAITGQAKPPAGWLDMAGNSNNAAGGVLGSRVGEPISTILIDGKAP